MIKRLFTSCTERLSTNCSNTPCVTSMIGMMPKTSCKMLFFLCGLTPNVTMKHNPCFYYLLGIVKNNCLNYLRSLNIQYKHQDKIIEAMLFSTIEDPEIDEDIHERLEYILNSLTGETTGSSLATRCREEKSS